MEDTQGIIEIDIKELFFVLVRNILWIVLAAAFGTGIAFAITRFLITPLYTSSVSLYVNNTAQDGQATAALNLNDINASQKLVNTYIVILQDNEMLEQVAEILMEEYTHESLEAVLPFTNVQGDKVLSPATIRGTLKMNAVNNTEVLQIESSTPNAELSARICTILTELAPEMLQRVVKAGSVEVIGSATPASLPSSPSMKRNCAMGFGFGTLLAVVIVLLRHLLDNTIKDEEDFRRRFNSTVLGEIPDFTVEQKGGYKRYGDS